MRSVQFTGDEADHRRLVGESADGPIDMVLDFVRREASAGQVRAAVLAIRLGGRVILMGGLRGEQGNLGRFSKLVIRDLSASSAITQEALEWTPTGPGLIEDIHKHFQST